ncbi:hypothetical protein C4D60_Mb06t11230 [Musa balbisiana]|uniref:Uncharacterized protein n=1 Tax=Musa balbisiana TaxID=52838 RepID=A0A4S8IMZ4_MUSBA|nr:hypothetical protein C4D60_Mb06t11230 [Musa balbisiana]
MSFLSQLVAGESVEKTTQKAVLDLGRSPRYVCFAFALYPSCLPEDYALPGRHGISDPGDEGIRFLDWLGSACTSVWQAPQSSLNKTVEAAALIVASPKAFQSALNNAAEVAPPIAAAPMAPLSWAGLLRQAQGTNSWKPNAA